MEAKAHQLVKEIIKLAERLREEAEETEHYLRKGDKTSALRNANDNRDELQDLVRKWQDLIHTLQK